MFAASIRYASNCPRQASRTRHIDNGTSALLLHEGQDRPHHFDRGRQVDCHYSIPFCVCDAVHAAETIHDTCNVDKQVDSPPSAVVKIISPLKSLLSARHSPE